MREMMKSIITLVALICLGYQANTVSGMNYGASRPNITQFQDITIDQEGVYEIDLDFDGVNERMAVDENSNIAVHKVNEYGVYVDVSNEVPYSMIRIHRCCEAHRAYTTINYLQQTIYTEAHYGSCDAQIIQCKKVGNDWIWVNPIKPLSIMNKDLYPQCHIAKRYLGSPCHWSWGNGKGGFHYWLRS